MKFQDLSQHNVGLVDILERGFIAGKMITSSNEKIITKFPRLSHSVPFKCVLHVTK